jgi:drug/metabolite transporter (DMT)-like permease
MLSMSVPVEPGTCASSDGSDVQPILYLSGVVMFLSTVPVVTKYVFQHSDVDPIGMACIRVGIGFMFLCAITCLRDYQGFRGLTLRDMGLLTLLGGLGVGSYVIAAWGIQHTRVTHYILIYSLLSPFTCVLSAALGKGRLSARKMLGILMALAGCVGAVSQKGLDLGISFGFGDLLILLFTLMMAVHIVLSVGVVKRLGPMIANTVMFGSSAVMLFSAAGLSTSTVQADLSFSTSASMLYVGVATAIVYLLRSLALQALGPAIVMVCHNLVPVTAILFAHLCLGETMGIWTFVGGAVILAGIELVRREHPVRNPVGPVGTKPLVSAGITQGSPTGAQSDLVIDRRR